MPQTLDDAVVPADRDRIAALVRATGVFSDDEIAVAVELVDERLERGPACGYHFIVVRIGPEVVGYACYGPIPCTRSSYDLYWIAVDPGAQRAGLGRRIIEATEARVRDAGGSRIYIETSSRSEYAPTRAFYEACGYECASRLEDFYGPGDDRLVYVKVLEDRDRPRGHSHTTE